MNAPVKSSLFHLVSVPPTALALALLLWESPGTLGGMLGIFALGLPFSYIILALPAIIHGLIFWKLKIEKQRKGTLPMILCVTAPTLGYFIWFILWGGKIKKDIDQAVIVMALASVMIYLISSRVFRSKADPVAVRQ
jgi:hypothetical protein